MSSISTPAGYRYTWYVRLIFWLQRRRYGQALEPARLWGQLPRSFLALTLLFRSLDREDSPIEPALRSLIFARIAQINWCAFCIDANSALALQRGVSEEKLRALASFQSSALFAEREKIALAYAEAVTLSKAEPAGGRPPGGEALLQRLRAHFSDQEIIELTALIAYQNMAAKFNSALNVQPQGFCERPQNAQNATPLHGSLPLKL